MAAAISALTPTWVISWEGCSSSIIPNVFSPFARVFVGGARIDPPTYIPEWNFAAGAGGGFDLNITHRFAIRLAQVDYIYTDYHTISHVDPAWNSIRLAAGVVVNLGNYYAPALAAPATAQPTEVTEGEPVTVTATGTNFNPKHTITYAWTTDGGKIDTANAQSAHIDTTGASAGSHTANATLTDAKMKKMNSATCSAPFTVKAKPMNPPLVSLLGQSDHGTGGYSVHHHGEREQPGSGSDHLQLRLHGFGRSD